MNNPKFYLAGTSMLTPLGDNTATAAAAIAAQISAYSQADTYCQNGHPITHACVPDIIFDTCDADVGEGDRFNPRHDRVTKMAIIALRDACSARAAQPIPLILAMPESPLNEEGLCPLIDNLIHNGKPWLSAQLSRSLHTGRAAGMHALDFAFRYLYESPYPFILIGGSDSYCDEELLTPLDQAGRLKNHYNADGFAPGEGASFLLLSRHPEHALVRNGHIIALTPPALSEEPGHRYSDLPYRGDGLAQAFQQVLSDRPANTIHSIYSSMNGEHYWAKEYGVALLRNRNNLPANIRLVHPAEYYGDLGAASASTLIALAAEHLFKTPQAHAHLVYSSSDGPQRGALVIEKHPVAAYHPPRLNY